MRRDLARLLRAIANRLDPQPSSFVVRETPTNGNPAKITWR